MPDFTLNTYKKLIRSLQGEGYSFQTFGDFITASAERVVVLRNDIDKLPQNALELATILNELKIKGSFYFRIVKESFDPEIIKLISSLGHEIGYHYEDLDLARGDIDLAFELFKKNLKLLKENAEIKTICMHGSPLSKQDNRDIWKKYDYKSLGIIAEPYFDVDYQKVLYLTDTGRRWNNLDASIRDKVDSPYKFRFRMTKELISNIDKFPHQIIINTHPQRWTNSPYLWTKELILQNIKNQVKKIVVKNRK